MRHSSTKERARCPKYRPSQLEVWRDARVRAAYANGALQALRERLGGAVDKEIVVDSFGLEAAVALGYPNEKREEGGDALVPCNRLGCWFAFDDLQTAAQKLLGRDERHDELCFQILADLGLYEFYASASRGLAGRDGRPAGGRPAARRAHRRLRAAQERRRRLLLDAIAAVAVASRALAAEDPDGAPSQVDDLVTLLGGAATVPLLKVLRRLSVDKGDDGELLAPLRALTSAESAVDGTLRGSSCSRRTAWGSARPRRRVAAPRPAVAARDRGGGAAGDSRAQKAKRWRERLRGAEVEALYALLAADDDEAAAAVLAPRPPAEREWASFCSAYDRIKGSTTCRAPGVAAGGRGCCGGGRSVLRLHRVGRRRSTDGGAVASLSLQEFSTLCKQCRLLAPYLSVSKIDLLFITIDRKHGDDVANGNPARALVLHEFMEASSASPPSDTSRSLGARPLLLAAPEQLLHRHILHYCGALGSAQNVRFTLGPKGAPPHCASRRRTSPHVWTRGGGDARATLHRRVAVADGCDRAEAARRRGARLPEGRADRSVPGRAALWRRQLGDARRRQLDPRPRVP